MRFSGINYESIVDGDGVRIVIFFSGCNHHCQGCHNKKTWDYNYGEEFSEDHIERIKKHLENNYISGITVSGGDLLCHPDNIVEKYLKILKELLNENQTLWVYTGYKFEEIRKKKYLKLIDVLVDGPFDSDLYDPDLKYRGSLNQRIIDVKKSLKFKFRKKIILLEGDY